MSLYQLPLTERHQHDCDRCQYRGSTFSAPTQHFDWYVCGGVKQLKPTVIKACFWGRP